MYHEFTLSYGDPGVLMLQCPTDLPTSQVSRILFYAFRVRHLVKLTRVDIWPVDADSAILTATKLHEVEVTAFSRLYTDHNRTSDLASLKIFISLWVHVSIEMGPTHTIAAQTCVGDVPSLRRPCSKYCQPPLSCYLPPQAV